MGGLIISASTAGLSSEVVEAMRAEMAACGLSGTLSIGPATGHPDLFALMWLVGSHPVLAGVPVASLRDVASAQVVAADFADKIRAAMKPLPPEPPADDYDYRQ